MTTEPMPEPEIVEARPATTAVVAGVVPMAELAAFFDGVFSTLATTIAEQGMQIAGPAFALYHGPPAETADLEAGFPTVQPVQPAGTVRPGSLPGGRVARVVHVGGYDGLGPAWERLHGWIVARGLTPGREFWEVYVTEPSPDMDPATLRTELNWSLA